MPDLNAWEQKLLQLQTGIRAPSSAIEGAQEGRVTQVGTAMLSLFGEPAAEHDVVWFSLPNTYGDDVGYGPAPYERPTVTVPTGAFGTTPDPTAGTPIPPSPVTLTADPPLVGDAVIVVFVGPGVGRPYVVAFMG